MAADASAVAALVSCIAVFLGRLDRVPDVSDAPFSRHPSGLIVLVVAIAALWEMYEWAALAIFPSPSTATGYDDTILDLAMGGAGAFVASLFILWWARTRRTPTS